MTATLINNLTGERIPVTATCEHSASSYGKPVWVDGENNAYLQVGLERMQPLYSIADKRMDDDDIINALALFLRDETLEKCPINIVSRENVEGEDAELVWFEWGAEKHKCPAIAWADGTVHTPCDWQVSYDEADFHIEEHQWMDCHFTECIMFEGMPRQPIV